MSLKQIAIIPARGGSKRIPGKNIRMFRGRPMIAHTIEAAIRTDLFSHVLVSTDSEQIAEVAVSAGAEVPFLRVSCADDMTPVSEATLAALQQAEEYYGEKFQNVCQLMANCPLRTPRNILDIWEFHTRNANEFSLSCFKFGFMNPWWALTLQSDGTGKRLFENTFVRSQDLPELHCPTGAIWLANAESLKRDRSFYGKNHKFFDIPWQNAVDIDNEEDIILADIVADYLQKSPQR